MKPPPAKCKGRVGLFMVPCRHNAQKGRLCCGKHTNQEPGVIAQAERQTKKEDAK